MARKRQFIYDLDSIDASLVNKEKDGVEYISKKAFDDAKNDELEDYRIVGRTCLAEPKGDEKDVSLLHVLRDDGQDHYVVKEYRSRRVKGYIPIGDRRYVELCGIWIPLIILCGVLALLLAIGGFACWYNYSGKVNPPDYHPEKVVDPNILVTITLPSGTTHFTGTVYDPAHEKTDDPEHGGEPYTGPVHIKVTLTVRGAEQLLIEQDVQVSEGQIPDIVIDFTKLSFELTPGTYEGKVEITYPDGSKAVKKIVVVIRDTYEGTVEVAYSDIVLVDRASGQVACSYAPEASATHDTIVQLILDRNGREYLLATSGIIRPGESLSLMDLDGAAAARFSAGTYAGRLRLNFYESGDDSGVAVNTDLGVTITVQ